MENFRYDSVDSQNINGRRVDIPVWSDIERSGDRKLKRSKTMRVAWVDKVESVGARPSMFKSKREFRKQFASKIRQSEGVHGTVNANSTDERNNRGVEYLEYLMGHLHVFSVYRL